MIDLMPNLTFFVQLGIFLLTFFFMNLLIFRPILRLIARRRELTEGYRQDAESLDKDTAKLVAEYEGDMKEARQEGLQVKSELTKGGEGKANDILQAARQDLEQTIERNRQEIIAESKEAQLVLRKYSRDLSNEIADKLLGRKVSA